MLQLDLTTSPWLLGTNRSRMIRGRDVVHIGRIAPDVGSRPLGVSLDSGDRPITSVIECSYNGRVPVRYQFYIDDDRLKVISSTVLRKFYSDTWDDEVVNGFIGFAPVYAVGGGHVDQGRYLWEYRQVTAVSEENYANDTLTFAPANSFTPITNLTKVWIDYQITVNRNGIIVSNGRKFWLLQDATYYQVMDLGSDDYLGTRWRGSMIALDRIMLTADAYPPRLFYFRDDIPNTDTADETSLAGITTPIKPASVEPQYIEAPVAGNNASFRMEAIAAPTGSLSAGDYKMKVRAVNLTTGGQSRMVTVWSYADSTLDTITVESGGAIKIHSSPATTANLTPPFDGKWTHIEVWRTEADGEEYFLEGRIPVVRFANEWHDDLVVSGNDGACAIISRDTDYYDYEGQISDANLNRRDQLATNDLISGYRPPVCKEAISIQDVTICAGQASASADASYVLPVRLINCMGSGTLYTHADRQLTYGGVSPANVFANYTWQSGDVFVMTAPSSGEYEIESKVSSSVILLASPGPGVDRGNVVGYIERDYTYEFEKISSDEDVWYSRTDEYAPESFLLRTLTLSRIGDKFMGLRAVGKYGVVVMADGVHLLYLTTDLLGTIVLEKHTVASTGAGTPWSDSIVTWERNVAWATKTGPVVMRVSDDADDTGARAQINSLDKDGAMRAWFEEAERLGETIDAGVDTYNECLRYRRQKSNGVQEVLQLSYRTGLWTLLYDTGKWYVQSRYADDTESTKPLLYSVLDNGVVREVNNRGMTYPYEGETMQAVTDETYTVTTTSLTKDTTFHADMIGELIYFRKAGAVYDGTWRVITSATTSAITFAAVTGLAEGAEYIIAPCQFKWRSAPILGTDPESVKTIRGLTVRARPGPRAEAAYWGEPSGTPLSVRTFRDHYAGAADDEALVEIPVYEESDVTKTSQSPVSTVTCQGNAIEVEVECLESVTDFVIQSVMASLREDSVALADASATS